MAAPFSSGPQIALDTWRLVLCFEGAVAVAGTVINMTSDKMRDNYAWMASAYLAITVGVWVMGITITKLGHQADWETVVRSLAAYFAVMFTYRSFSIIRSDKNTLFRTKIGVRWIKNP